MGNDLKQLRIVRRPEVEKVTGLSRATLYRLIAAGEFPAPVRLTAGYAVGWRASEVREWLESRETVGAGITPTSKANEGHDQRPAAPRHGEEPNREAQ